MNHNLTIKQKAFADRYIKTGNATQSYIDAGYSVGSRNTAEVNGHRLLRNAKVQAYLDDVNEKIDSERIANMKEVKEFWTNTIRDKDLDLRHRLRASEYVAKTNGAFIDRVEQSGSLGLVVTWGNDEE